ncbi:MAG TPA: ferritin-like domain-containing protein [Candidatus Bathyarchaeia archaeon]
MASKELLEKMNTAIAMEMQVAIQYMWQHVQWSGVKGFAVKGELRSFAVEEMKHAEMLAERLFYLGQKPTTKPTPIFVGEKLKDMLAQDKKDEEGAIKLYKETLELAWKEGDHTTHKLIRGILSDEEEHHDTFVSLLEEV